MAGDLACRTLAVDPVLGRRLLDAEGTLFAFPSWAHGFVYTACGPGRAERTSASQTRAVVHVVFTREEVSIGLFLCRNGWHTHSKISAGESLAYVAFRWNIIYTQCLYTAYRGTTRYHTCRDGELSRVLDTSRCFARHRSRTPRRSMRSSVTPACPAFGTGSTSPCQPFAYQNECRHASSSPATQAGRRCRHDEQRRSGSGRRSAGARRARGLVPEGVEQR